MRADLHIHSIYSSDGKSTLEQIVNAATGRGFGCIAVTDHNSFASYEESSKYDGIIVIPAEEVSSAEGHILAYGISEEIPKGRSVTETIEMIHSAGGIAVAAHPYRWWSGLGEKNIVGEFDAIEIHNARSTKGSNRKADKLARRMRRPVTAGSDAHHADNIGGAFVEFSDDITNWEDAVKAVLASEVKINGKHRTRADTLRYGFKSITEWMGRGFKKM